MKAQQPMREWQQLAGSFWRVAAGEARSLRIGPGRRTLRVNDGALWLTAPGAADAPAEDFWLQPGDAVALPSGAEIVIEGWPEASFQLLVPPCKATARSSISAWLSRRLSTWRVSARPQLAAGGH